MFSQLINTKNVYTARAIKLLAGAGYTGRAQTRRITGLANVLRDHPDALVVRCADEKSGVRFGNAECRAGRAIKLGYTSYCYQLWAVWPAAPLCWASE